MNTFFKSLISTTLLAIALVATPAWAISKDDAKAQGMIGERSNGYLGIVTSKPSADLRTLVSQINDKRKSAYVKGAKNAGVDRTVFEIRMGQRLQQRTPAGQYIQLDNGKWTKK